VNQPPLLPSDSYIASLLGLSADEYQWFKREVQQRARIEPGKPVAGLETLVVISLVFTAISVGLTIAASFFKPKARQQGVVNTSNPDPDNITRNQKFAPRAGFDSVQKPAILATTIPIIYANRQTLGASSSPLRPNGTYGGIRVNLQLVWSQMLSTGGDQMLRSIFMLGEGDIQSIEGLAIGDNQLGAYDLLSTNAMNTAARLSVYYRSGGGRIQPSDYLLGRIPLYDLGNAVQAGGADVYEIRDRYNFYRPHFCYTYKPSNSTVFGLSGWLPNGVGYRVNPTIEPVGQIEKQSRSDGKKFEINWIDDYVALGNLWKNRYQFHRRCCFLGESRLYVVGEIVQYMLFQSSDADTVFIFNKDNARQPDAEPADGRVKCTDVASSIASKQSAVDESLVIGNVYKIGSCLAVLISKTPDNEVFVSDVDNYPVGNGVHIVYGFRVVRDGYVTAGKTVPTWSGTEIRPDQWNYYFGEDLVNIPVPDSAEYPTVSMISQGFKCDIADITLPKSAQVFEIGLKSTVGMRVNGLCNFRDAKSYQEANDNAGGKLRKKIYPAESSIGVQVYRSGTVSMAEERYSFFRVYVRPSSASDYRPLRMSFAVKSRTSQPIYNYFRLGFNTTACWQLRFEPITSWEIRNGFAETPFIVLDSKVSDFTTWYSDTHDGCWVSFSGYTVNNNTDTFKLVTLEPTIDLGLNYSDKSNNVMTDAWGKVAEAFPYDEIQTTVSESPEHEVVYINLISENNTAPLYDNLSILGLNIRAAQQWSQLSQVSTYVNQGRAVRRLLNSDSPGASNLFPDILRDLLLSERFGMGESISEAQIDVESFRKAAYWCAVRRYFFDGIIADKTNLRQWAADTSAGMLLEFIQRDGKFVLEPAIVFPTETVLGLVFGPVIIKGIFTVGNIMENSFSMEFLAEEDRQPIQVSVKWREERLRDNYSSSGLFPTEREVLVREAQTADTAPIESFDMAEYCTNFEHAVDFACYIIRVRRLVSHTIKFSTTPDGLDTNVRAGDYIKVALDFTFYDEFSNGVILENGTIVSTRPDLMTTGTHESVYWDGSDAPVSEGNIIVDENGLASPTGVIFIKKNTTSQIRVYKVESLSLGENGVIDIEAVHHPVDSAGISEIGKNWTTYQTDSNWIIKTG
jgi:hypothetical protein